MADITAALVKELRARTGVGVMECKKALDEANGDIDIAISNIRKFDQTKVARKYNRIATEGVILAKVTGNVGVLLELNCETDFVAKDANFLAFGKNIVTTVIVERITDVDILKNKFKDQYVSLLSRFGENIDIRRVAIIEGDKIGSYLHGMRIGVLVALTSADEELIKHIAMHIAASKPEYINPEDIPADVFAHEYQIQMDIAMQSDKSREIVEKIVQGRMHKFTSEISLTRQYFIMDLSKTIGQLLKEKGAEVIKFIRFEVGEGIEKIKNDFAVEVATMSKHF